MLGTGAAASISTGSALAHEGSSDSGDIGKGDQRDSGDKPNIGKIRRYLHNFDPSSPGAIKEAVGYLLLIDSRDMAEKVLFSLSDERQDALKHAIKHWMGIELETNRDTVKGTPESLDSNQVAIATVDKTYHCKGILKNATFGTTEAIFDHYVHWNYGGDTVDNFSHWKRVRTPGWLTYWNGMTTNYIDNREDYGVSKMAGQFKACVTKWGCYLSTSVGSGIWVYPNGTAACNEWNDTH